MTSIYLHVPFCMTKCPYCDFYSLAWEDRLLPEEAFLVGLEQELELWKAWLSPERGPIRTIFFGGGTPSLLSPASVARILTILKEAFAFAPGVEVTLELNPKTADLAKLQAFCQAGVTRVSMGLQSLDDLVLQTLGRDHTAAQALETLQALSKAGFHSYSVDLMYGLPQQTVASFAKTLEGLQDFALPHLSAYELIVEKATPFYRWHEQGQLKLPQEEATLAMEDLLQAFCQQRGLEPYEISNYAKAGQACRHNLVYWDYKSFLGLGPGAVGFLRPKDLSEAGRDFWQLVSGDSYGLRFSKKRDWGLYQKQAASSSTWERELVSWEQARSEFFMMALRKTAGTSVSAYEKLFAEKFPKNFWDILKKYQSKGWVEIDESRFWLTREGLRFSQEVMGEFF